MVESGLSDMSDSRPPEAIHGLLMCSERIAQEENFKRWSYDPGGGSLFSNGEGVLRGT